MADLRLASFANTVLGLVLLGAADDGVHVARAGLFLFFGLGIMTLEVWKRKGENP